MNNLRNKTISELSPHGDKIYIDDPRLADSHKIAHLPLGTASQARELGVDFRIAYSDEPRGADLVESCWDCGIVINREDLGKFYPNE